MTKILEFWAPWCGPCKAYGPVVEQAVQQIGADLIKINIDEDTYSANIHSVRSVPTVIVIKDGTVVNRIVGSMSLSKLLEQLQ